MAAAGFGNNRAYQLKFLRSAERDLAATAPLLRKTCQRRMRRSESAHAGGFAVAASDVKDLFNQAKQDVATLPMSIAEPDSERQWRCVVDSRHQGRGHRQAATAALPEWRA
jgi:hypothetical protein